MRDRPLIDRAGGWRGSIRFVGPLERAPPFEDTQDRDIQLNLAIPVVAPVFESRLVAAHVEISPRHPMLVGVHPAAIRELDLVHPHEPAEQRVGQRFPVRSLVLD